jgi:uncharacterized repeat protein (TIGR02543 family)/CSLREA domain-containing protein
MENAMKRIFNLLVLITLLALTFGAAGVTPAYAAGITVNTNTDNVTTDGLCSLREAINNANSDSDTTGGDCIAGSGADTITFAGDYTINLETAQLQISQDVTIDGSGQTIIINGPGSSCVTCFRVFNISTAGKTVVMKHLTIANGWLSSGEGSAIANNGSTVTISDSNFNNNNSIAIYNANATLTISDSNFNNNVTAIKNTTGGKVIVSGSNFTGGTNTVIHTYNGLSVDVDRCTFSGNTGTAIDSFYGLGVTVTVTNSTFYNNTSGMGVIYTRTNLIVKNSVFSNNQAYSIKDFANCGTSPACTLELGNNIFANAVGGYTHFNGGGSQWIDLGHNISDQNMAWTDPTSMQNTNPLLGTIGNYGGLTSTLPLLPGSPAIDAGDAAICAALPVGDLDQRGFSRVEACDIGPFESRGFTLAYNSGSPQTAIYNSAFSAPLMVDVASKATSPVEPVDGGKITFTAPGTGASATFTSNPVTISSGSAKAFATANSIADGPYTVTASANGVTGTADFSLTNRNAIVTFDANNGTGTMDPQSASAATALTSNAFTRADYTFSGWNTLANGNGTNYPNNDIYNFTADLTLFAQWTANPTHTVTYDLNGGTGTTPIQADVAEGASFNVASGAGFSKAGFTFTGWKDQSNASYTAGSSYTMDTSNVTLTAQWNTNPTHTVTYDLNGGTGTTPIQADVAEGASFNVASGAGFSKAGFTFTGWKDQSNASYTAGSSYTMSTSNVTLTAQWNTNPTHTVTYNLNGGTGTTPTQADVAEGVSFNVAGGAGFSKAGFTFNGWKDQLNASYTAGSSYTMSTSNVTLTAQWNTNPTHTVTYNLNGGTGTLPTQADVAEGASFNVASGAGFSKAGFTFNGWKDQSNASYAAGSSYTMSTTNVTLTAQWNANPTHTVTYNLNGGTGTTPTQADVAEGASFNVASGAGFSKAGFTFNGWKDQSNASYAAGSSYTMSTTNVTLTAQWNANPTHTVTYNLNGGTGTTPTQADVSEGASFNVASGAGFSKAGFTFSGWKDQANASYTAGSSYTMSTSNVTLTAQWTANPTHTVTFEANGGTGSMTPQTASLPTALTLNAFTRTGYSFNGWNTLANGSGTAYTNGATYGFAADLTLYAQWKTVAKNTLLLKPDFSGSYVFTYPWNVTGVQPPLTRLLDCGIFRSRPCSVHLTGGKGVNITIFQNVKLAGQAGDSYSFGIANRTANGIPASGNFQVELVFYNSWNKIVGSTVLKLPNTAHGWKTFTQTATAPANYTHMVFRFIFQKSGGTAWFDDAFLSKLP